MNTLKQISYLTATAPAFRQALRANSQAAIASWNLDLSVEELTVISTLRHLLAIPPQELSALLLSPNQPRWDSVLGGTNPLFNSGQAGAFS